MLLKINMNLYTILHMYLGLSAKWKANTYNQFGLFNLIAIKNTHMLSTCQTVIPCKERLWDSQDVTVSNMGQALSGVQKSKFFFTCYSVWGSVYF
jgi:hypothetical protein